MLKNSENNGTEEIGLVTPTPGDPPGTYHSMVQVTRYITSMFLGDQTEASRG